LVVIKDFDLNSDIWAFRGHYDAAIVRQIEKRAKNKFIATGHIIVLLKKNMVNGVHASLYPTRIMSSIFKFSTSDRDSFDEIAISESTPLHQGIKSTIKGMLESKQIISLETVTSMIRARQGLINVVHYAEQDETDKIQLNYKELIGTNRILPTGERYQVVDVKELFTGNFIGVIDIVSDRQKHCRDIQLILGDIIPVDAF
jgi:hypothetical protein